MMTPTTLALARRVRALLEAPERWTQLGWAVDRKGRKVSADSDDAVAWCLAGAASKLAGGSGGEAYREFLRVCRMACGDVSVANWQSDVTHADVLALLDRVIAEGERCHERAAVD